jgi:heme-degrading monooxygenase HmoA
VIAVIFEVEPTQVGLQPYLDHAAALRAELEKIDGFISVERFRSLVDPKRLLSLSFFRDEAAVQAWRNLPHHRAAQALGRGGLFADYRLRIASVQRDYGLHARAEAPDDSLAAHGGAGM